MTSPLAGSPTASAPLDVSLLTGGGDKPYAFGMATALLTKQLRVDYIGSDEVDSPELHTNPNLRFLRLRGSQSPDAPLWAKVSRILLYYIRLIGYAAVAKPRIFHLLWNNRFQTLDRTALMLYYKLLGKIVVFTVHNVNREKRDGIDSWLNRFTLRIQYRLADHFFVHTEKMKTELVGDFDIGSQKVTVIPFGINNAVPHTSLTAAQAKERLHIGNDAQTVLFFGRIAPYKGLEFLVSACQQLALRNRSLRLIIAGQPRHGSEEYLRAIQRAIMAGGIDDRVIQVTGFIPDEDVEIYFKAADVLVLPYTEVFQSGVLFLAYSFGLPVIATDVGSFDQDIVEGRTGFMARSADPVDLMAAMETYFASELFANLAANRPAIAAAAHAQHSWDVVADKTVHVYRQLLEPVALRPPTTVELNG